jgi:hypothetical protein
MTPERIAELRKQIAYLGESVEREMLDALESAQAELAAVRGAMDAADARLRDASIRVWGEDCWGCDAPDHMAEAILGLRSAPEGKVLVDAGELKALRATIAKLKEFRDPVNVAKRIEEYAAQHKPAQREVVPNGTGWWFMEGDQGQRTTTAANASQHPGQGGNGGDHA